MRWHYRRRDCTGRPRRCRRRDRSPPHLSSPSRVTVSTDGEARAASQRVVMRRCAIRCVDVPAESASHGQIICIGTRETGPALHAGEEPDSLGPEQAHAIELAEVQHRAGKTRHIGRGAEKGSMGGHAAREPRHRVIHLPGFGKVGWSDQCRGGAAVREGFPMNGSASGSPGRFALPLAAERKGARSLVV